MYTFMAHFFVMTLFENQKSQFTCTFIILYIYIFAKPNVADPDPVRFTIVCKVDYGKFFTVGGAYSHLPASAQL